MRNYNEVEDYRELLKVDPEYLVLELTSSGSDVVQGVARTLVVKESRKVCASLVDEFFKSNTTSGYFFVEESAEEFVTMVEEVFNINLSNDLCYCVTVKDK